MQIKEPSSLKGKEDKNKEEMKRKEKDKLKKISKSQVVKNKILINNNKNLFVILEKMSMKEE